MSYDYYYGGLGVGAAIIIWVLCIGAAVGLAFIPATIARKKGYSYGGFWALGFFFFIVGLIVALCLEDKNAPKYGQPYQPYQQPYQQQPYQQPNQQQQPYQQQTYGQPYQQQPYQQQPYQQPYQAPASEPQTVSCPSCGASVAADSAFCPKCGAKIQ